MSPCVLHLQFMRKIAIERCPTLAFTARTLQTIPLRANIPETVLVPLINEQGEKEKGRYEFSWCCSFSWGFGWRGTERRRAKRAAAQWSDSQSGRRFGREFATRSRSGCQTEAADLHS